MSKKSSEIKRGMEKNCFQENKSNKTFENWAEKKIGKLVYSVFKVYFNHIIYIRHQGVRFFLSIFQHLPYANWHFSFYFSLFFFLLFSSFRCSQLNDSTTFFYVRLYEFCLWHSFEAVTLRKMLLCFVALSPFEMAIVKKVRKKTKKEGQKGEKKMIKIITLSHTYTKFLIFDWFFFTISLLWCFGALSEWWNQCLFYLFYIFFP